MRRVNNSEDSNIVVNSLARHKDLKSTKDNDLKGLRMSNASPAKNDFDYVTLSQINPRFVFKIGVPLVGTNVTNRVTCEAQPGVRLLRWRFVSHTGPIGSNNIYDIKKVAINGNVADAVSIFPIGNDNKIIHETNAIRGKGAKFHHTPYDILYEEELVFDVLTVGDPSGTQVFLELECQLLGIK